MNLVSSNPWWCYLLCVVFGMLCAALLYRNDKKLAEFSALAKLMLFILRFVGTTFLAVLLLSPLIRYFSKNIEKPIVIIAQDVSSSMVSSRDSTFIKEELNLKLNELEDDLEESLEVDRYAFGSSTVNFNDSISYDDKATNFEELLTNLESKYANRNIGGLVLISDGIYNQGSNPQYLFNSSAFPIFAVATGDTAAYLDVKLSNLRANKIAFLGNEFPVQFDLSLQKTDVKFLNLSILNNGVVIKNEKVKVDKNNFTFSTNLKATQIGQQQYTVEIEPLEGERNTLNNSASFYIDVVDGRQKVAILGVVPHPDLSAIKKSIEVNENYEVTTGLLKDFRKNAKDFDLVILHNIALASTLKTNEKLDQIVNSLVPVFFVGGGWNTIATNFGIELINGSSSIKNAAYGLVNSEFSLYNIPDNFLSLKNLPPLQVSSGKSSSLAANKVLLYQKIGNVETEYPLLSFHEKDGRKSGILVAEGFWRWRMADYANNQSFDLTNELINKTIQYLAVKENRNFFRVSASKSITENENLNFSAQLYNPSYELINDPEVSLTIQDKGGKEYKSTFSKSSNAYQLNLKSLPVGEYNYSATTSFQGKKLVENGYFVIKPLQLEQLETKANHNLLYQLTANTNGKIFTTAEIESLSETILNRTDITSISYIDENVEEVINIKWLFYIILLLLSIEWFVRKRGGAY